MTYFLYNIKKAKGKLTKHFGPAKRILAVKGGEGTEKSAKFCI